MTDSHQVFVELYQDTSGIVPIGIPITGNQITGHRVKPTGSYPVGWVNVAPINEPTAKFMLLRNLKPASTWLMNKEYITYAMDSIWMYAIWNNDGYWTIIRKKFCE